MSLNFRWLAIALLLLPAMATGCGTPQATAPQGESQTGATASSPQTDGVTTDEITVVATFLPMYLFTKAVAGDAAAVEILIQPGTEVHDYQSTPADVQLLSQADVVVENGLGFEEFLDRTIDSAQNPDLKVIDASEGINPVGALGKVVYPVEEAAHEYEPDEHGYDHTEGEAQNHADDHAAGEADHADDEEHAEEQGGARTHTDNPHVWLDPLLAIQQVENIRDGLVAADPANRATYEANAAAYIGELQALDRQFKERLQGVSDRTFITFHDAFPYLAQRYNLQQVAIVAIPEDSLVPGDIQKTIEAVQQFDVKALFGEPGVDNKLLQSLSQDLNLQLHSLNALESGELDPQYYFTAMEQNLDTLVEAFE